MREWQRRNKTKVHEYQSVYRSKNKDKAKERYATWMHNNPGKIKERGKKYKSQRDSYNTAYKLRNKDKYKGYFLKARYGITNDDFQEMVESQDGLCLICKKKFGRERSDRPNIDHCHETGKIRGLLCGSCNKGLGHFRDNPDLLRVAADYIERNLPTTAQPQDAQPV